MYANGIDSKINVHTKFKVSVFVRCRVTQRVQKFKSRSCGCLLFYVHSNFTLLAQYFLLSICAPNLKLVATAIAWIGKSKCNNRSRNPGHVPI